MKIQFMKSLSGLLFAVFALNILPAPAVAQGGTDQEPLLIMKVPNIVNLLDSVRQIAEQAGMPDASDPMDSVRTTLGGTEWIDTDRSIAVGLIEENGKTAALALIPFRIANDSFRDSMYARAGADYYILPLPPQPDFSVSSILEQTLIDASTSPAEGSIVIEAAASKLIALAEPVMAIALAQVEETQPPDAPEQPLSLEDMQSVMTEMFALLKQAETLRIGLDLNENDFSVLMDVVAQPGSDLAAALVDIGGERRLNGYVIDMPVRYNTRPYNISGAQKVMLPYLETIYGMLGLNTDIDEIMQMSENMTGEQVAGLNISPDGIVLRMVAALQPGIDGASFLRDSYLPFLERYTNSISQIATEGTGKTPILTVQRTADGSIGGVQTMGLHMHIQSGDEANKDILDNMDFEMRMASVNGLMFLATSDAEIGESIAGTRNLVSVPAEGPTGQFVVDIGRLMKSIQALMPQDKPAPNLPDDLGKITVRFDVENGTLKTRTSLGREFIETMIQSIKEAASRNPIEPIDGNPEDTKVII